MLIRIMHCKILRELYIVARSFLQCKLLRCPRPDGFRHSSTKADIMTDFMYRPYYINQYSYMDVGVDCELLIDRHDTWTRKWRVQNMVALVYLVTFSFIPHAKISIYLCTSDHFPPVRHSPSSPPSTNATYFTEPKSNTLQEKTRGNLGRWLDTSDEDRRAGKVERPQSSHRIV